MSGLRLVAFGVEACRLSNLESVCGRDLAAGARGLCFGSGCQFFGLKAQPADSETGILSSHVSGNRESNPGNLTGVLAWLALCLMLPSVWPSNRSTTDVLGFLAPGFNGLWGSTMLGCSQHPEQFLNLKAQLRHRRA